MARKPKLNVDYFPHIINQGKTIFILESNYGNDGYAFWFKLLEILGNTENHFIDCNNKSTWQYMLAKTRVSEDIAKSILNILADLEAIDRDLWNKNIIFSQKFIDNITDLYRRRGIDVVNKQAVLDLCKQKLITNDNNVDIKLQIKRNKKKLNKNKLNEIKSKETINIVAKQVIDLFNEIYNKNCKYVESNLTYIRARLKEGYTLENFETVFRKKLKDIFFINEPKYYRIKTLCGTNFDGYLNEKIRASPMTETGIKTQLAGEEFKRLQKEQDKKKEK